MEHFSMVPNWPLGRISNGLYLHMLESASDFALMLLVSKSAGLSVVGQYFHIVAGNNSVIYGTWLATIGFSFFLLFSQ